MAGELLPEEDEDGASQAVERLESIGNAACCLKDTFEVLTPDFNHLSRPSPFTAMGSFQAASLVKRMLNILESAYNSCTCIQSGTRLLA